MLRGRETLVQPHQGGHRDVVVIVRAAKGGEVALEVGVVHLQWLWPPRAPREDS